VCCEIWVMFGVACRPRPRWCSFPGYWGTQLMGGDVVCVECVVKFGTCSVCHAGDAGGGVHSRDTGARKRTTDGGSVRPRAEGAADSLLRPRAVFHMPYGRWGFSATKSKPKRFTNGGRVCLCVRKGLRTLSSVQGVPMLHKGLGILKMNKPTNKQTD
jgi:hypothetical protein